MRNRYSRFLILSVAWTAAVGTVLYFGELKKVFAAAGQTQSAFNAGRERATEDPGKVIHGKALYGINCQACHGLDLRGGDAGGPNLLRSQATLTDEHGEMIIPIIQGARLSQGMPNIGLNNEDAGAVAAYIRSVISRIGSQGSPPGEKRAPLNIVVGDAGRGEVYFTAHCSSCHSATADLKGIATTYAEPEQLQAHWLSGGANRRTAFRMATVDVTTLSGKTISGGLVHIDDFLVVLKLQDGSQRSFTRTGAVPKVVVHDPMQAHRDMLQHYTDRDIHDVTAYLVTLK